MSDTLVPAEASAGEKLPGLSIGSILGSGLLGVGGSIIGNAINYGLKKKYLNLQMQREDNAIQRRAADLKAAGINPLLAGSIGGASVGNYTAPSIDTNIASKGLEAASVGASISAMKLANKAQQEQIKQTQAQTKMIGLETALKLEQLQQWKEKGLPEYSTLGKTIQDLLPYIKPFYPNGMADFFGDGNKTGIPFFDVGVASTKNMFDLATHPDKIPDAVENTRDKFVESEAGKKFNDWWDKYMMEPQRKAEERFEENHPKLKAARDWISNKYHSAKNWIKSKRK